MNDKICDEEVKARILERVIETKNEAKKSKLMSGFNQNKSKANRVDFFVFFFSSFLLVVYLMHSNKHLIWHKTNKRTNIDLKVRWSNKEKSVCVLSVHGHANIFQNQFTNIDNSFEIIIKIWWQVWAFVQLL